MLNLFQQLSGRLRAAQIFKTASQRGISEHASAELEAGQFKRRIVEVGRFKGLGEMNPGQLRETTMNPATRGLLRITLPLEYEGRAAVKDLVDRLMGRDPAQRLMFIQNRAGEIEPEMIDA